MHSTKQITFFKTVSLIAIFFAFFLIFGKADASSGDNVTGYAWSANIGWISFNCTSQPGGCTATPGGYEGGGGDIPDADEDDIGYIGFSNTESIFAFDTETAFGGLLAKIVQKLSSAFPAGLLNTAPAFADALDAYGSSYGVSVDPVTGNFSGYAWSPYVGWISFNEYAGCPEGSCAPHLAIDTGKITGWAKALSASGTSGWDGWISLSCTNTSFICSGYLGAAPNYGLTYNNATKIVSGYAWGDDVVGWMSFDGPTYEVMIDLDQPLVSLTASGATFCPDTTTTLTWSAVGDGLTCTASSTNADPAFTGPIATSGTAIVTPSAPSTTYTISCIAPGSDANYQSSVTVALGDCGSDLILSASPTPVTAATGYTTTLTWYSPTLTNFSSCIGTAYNVSLGVPPMTLAVPPTGFEGVHTPPMAPLYTQSDAGVYVSNTTNKFVIDCVRADTGAHVIAETLVTRAILYPTCAFNNGGTFLSGSPTKATLSWTSTDALTASATSTPGVGVTWTGTQLLSGIKSNVNFVGSSTTYFLNVGAGAETSQCKAVLDIPVLCDTATEICDCDPEVPGGSCYEDPNCEDPNGCEPDKIGALTLTATPNTFTLDEGETATTALTWDGNGVDGTGVTWSSPATSFGPVNCAIDGTDSVTISLSTVFTLTCNDIFGGPDIPATTSITVNGIDPPCDFIPDNGIEDCDPPITGFTRPVFIER